MNSLGAELYGRVPIGKHATTRVYRHRRHRAHGVPVEAVWKMGPKFDSESEPRSFDLDQHETVEELRALPDAEIERRHDVLMRSVSDPSIGDTERQIRIGRAHAY
jgi:hypothetical protein